MISSKIKRWFLNQKRKHKLKVKIIDINNIKGWILDRDKIYHKSKKFFKIIGIKISTNFYKYNWDQPIIVQNEIGILGIIKNIRTNRYLLQAKVEPGNINKIQIAPTVQATKSNYTQAHGGKKIPFINFFFKKENIQSSKQSEQRFRYLNKFNSNILFKTSSKIKINPEFYWFSKKEIKSLIRLKNLINMDTISVFSSFIKKLNNDNPINSFKNINLWIKKNDKRFFIKTKIVSLSKLNDWKINHKHIVNKDNKHFSIIGTQINANKREVSNWSQPIIKGKKLAFAGFIKSRFNNTEHYLCRYILKPGLKSSSLSCTVNTSDISKYKKNKNLNLNEINFLKNYFVSKSRKNKITFDNILSDEGGRFYQCQIRYMVLNLTDIKNLKVPDKYIWVSHNQMVNLIKNKKIDIEARLLFGSINIDNIS